MHWPILSSVFLISVFFLVWIIFTVIKTLWAIYYGFCISRINPGTFCEAIIIRCTRDCASSMPLSSNMLDSLFASQLFSLSFGLSKSPLQSSQFSLSEIHSGSLAFSMSAGWWLIRFIRGTFNTWVRHPGRSFADKAVGTGGIFDNLNVAAPSCCKFDQDTLATSSVSEIYPMAVICLFWARYSFCVEYRFWLQWHMSKSCRPWPFRAKAFVLPLSTFPSRYQYLFCPKHASSPADNPWLPWANYLTTPLLEGSGLSNLSASNWSHLAQVNNLPPLRHHVVWSRICRIPHWRDRSFLNAVLLADASSHWYPGSKMYCESPQGWSGNHYDLDHFALRSAAIQVVNSNRALRL